MYDTAWTSVAILLCATLGSAQIDDALFVLRPFPDLFGHACGAKRRQALPAWWRGSVTETRVTHIHRCKMALYNWAPNG